MECSPILHVPIMPDDMLFEILRRSEWEEILTVRQVSRSCYNLTNAREIWMRLIHSFMKPRASTPQIHSLERPIHSHTSTELESIWLKWMKARRARYQPRPDMFKAPRYFALNAPVFGRHDDSLTFLVNGGRWFVEFGIDGSAFYYDLEDAVEPHSRPLIPPVPGNPARISIFPPYNNPSLQNGLSFFTGVTYLLNNSWTTDIWLVCMPQIGHGIPSLTAFHKKRFSLVANGFSLGACDLSPATVAYHTQLVTGSPNGLSAIALVQWPLVDNNAANVPRRVLFPDHKADKINLLPGGRLLVHCATTTTMLNYETSALFNFMPTPSQANSITNEHVLRTLPEYIPLEARIFLSRPYIASGSRHEGELITQTLVMTLDRGGTHVFRLTITTQGTILTTKTTLVGSMDHDLQASSYFASSSHCISNRGNDLQKFATYTWTQGESSRLNVKLTRIPCKNGMPHLMGTLYDFDEDSGRMLFFCERLRVMSVFDLA